MPLSAGYNFPVPPQFGHEELIDDIRTEYPDIAAILQSAAEHRFQIVEALNQAAAAAFTDNTTFDEVSFGGVALNDSGFTDLGLSISQTPLVPGSGHLIFVGYLAVGAALTEINFRLQENGSQIKAVAVKVPANAKSTFVIQDIRTFIPETTYTYTLDAKILTASQTCTVADESNLSLRVEHRRLT